MDIKRGDIVSYWREPGVPLKVISEPYIFNGQEIVTARKIAKKKTKGSRGCIA